MGTKYGTIHKEYCQKAADYLEAAFSFSQSAEGEQFWYAVHSRLRELQRTRSINDRPDVPCWKQKDDDATVIARLQREVVVRDALIQQRDETIQKQTDEIVSLSRKLKVANWCNYGR